MRLPLLCCAVRALLWPRRDLARSSQTGESSNAVSEALNMSQDPAEKWSVNEVRRTFIDFFVKKKQHVFFPSSPVVPVNDPTLLFCNSGIRELSVEGGHFAS